MIDTPNHAPLMLYSQATHVCIFSAPEAMMFVWSAHMQGPPLTDIELSWQHSVVAGSETPCQLLKAGLGACLRIVTTRPQRKA